SVTTAGAGGRVIDALQNLSVVRTYVPQRKRRIVIYAVGALITAGGWGQNMIWVQPTFACKTARELRVWQGIEQADHADGVAASSMKSSIMASAIETFSLSNPTMKPAVTSIPAPYIL